MVGASKAKAGNAFVTIGAIDQTGRTLKRIQANFQRLGATLRNIGIGLTTASVALAMPIANGVQVFAEFDDAMRRVEARSSGSESELEALTIQAKELGRQTVFTASAIADMQSKLAIKGFDRGQIFKMTEDIQALSRAIGDGEPILDLRMSADVVGSIIRGFNMDASETGRIVDALAAGASESNLNLEGLRDGLKFIGPLAARTGMNIEEVVSMMGMLANVSIESGIGGRSLRRALLGIVDSETVDAFNKRLGEITGKEVVFQGRKMNEILFDIGKVLKDLSKEEQIDIISDLVGKEAATAAVELAFGVDKYRKVFDEVNKAHKENRAAKMQETMNKSLKASFLLLEAAVEGVKIALGESLKPTIISTMDAISAFLDKAAVWIENNGDLVRQIILGIGAVGAFGIALTGAGFAMYAAGPLIGMLATGISAAATAFGFLMTPLGMATAAIAVLAVSAGKAGSIVDMLVGQITDLARLAKSEIKLIISSDGVQQFKSELSSISQMFLSGEIELAFDTLILVLQEKWIRFTNWLGDTIAEALNPKQLLNHFTGDAAVMGGGGRSPNQMVEAVNFMEMAPEERNAAISSMTQEEKSELARTLAFFRDEAAKWHGEPAGETTSMDTIDVTFFDALANRTDPDEDFNRTQQAFNYFIDKLDDSFSSTRTDEEKRDERLASLREKIEKNLAQFRLKENQKTVQKGFDAVKKIAGGFLDIWNKNTEQGTEFDSQIIEATPKEEEPEPFKSPIVASAASLLTASGIEQAIKNQRNKEAADAEAKKNDELLKEARNQTSLLDEQLLVLGNVEQHLRNLQVS